MVDATEQTMHAAGISSFQMDLRPLAISRAAHQENAIVVNLEPDCFDIVFVTGGIPRVIYTVNPRSDSATIEDNIHRLADELAKAAAFYQSNNPKMPLSPSTPLLLTGDLTTEPAAVELLESQVEYPIGSIAPLAEYPAALPVAAYAAGIGLALKSVSLKTVHGVDSGYQDIDINILDGKYRKSAARPVSRSSLLGGALLVIAIVLLVPLFMARANMSNDNIDLTIELAGLNHELNLANAEAARTAQDEASIRGMTDSAAGLLAADKMVLDTRGNYTRDLARLMADLPPDTYFINTEINDDQITIQGETDSVFTVVEYATVLESEQYFTSVRIVRLNEKTNYTEPSPEDNTSSDLKGTIGFTILIKK
jgi:Tfp pilus assembly protein PilN